MQASARTCGRRAADSVIQNVGLSPVRSSQYTLIIPHRVIQLTTASFCVPPTSQQIGQFPLKRVKYRHGHPFFFFLSSSSFTEELSLLPTNQRQF